MSKSFEIEPDLGDNGIGAILSSPEVKRAVSLTADKVARRAEGMAGTIDGEPVRVKRFDDEVTTGKRGRVARSAMMANHPTSKGRAQGIRALRAAAGTAS